MNTNYNFNSTSNYNYTIKSQNSNPQIQAINMDTKDYDKKIDFENSNLYFYRNIGLNFKPDNEFKDRYNNKLTENDSLLKRIKDLEVQLQSTNTKIEEIKDNLERQIENEKELKKAAETESENKIKISVKNEYENQQKEKNLNDKYKELKDKNVNLEKEIKELKDENLRLKNKYNDEKNLLNNKTNLNEKNLINQIEELEKENELMITRNNNQLKKILDEKDKELKSYEKAFQEIKNKKEEYELNNILLQRQFNDLKAEKENESLEKENNIKDTGIKNRDKIIEEYMKKFSDIDNEKQKYYDKYSKMSEEFQKLSKEVIEEKLKLEEEDEKLRRENIQLQKENESMQNIISKHNTELTQRDEIINNLRNNLNEINLKIKSNFDKSNDAINQLSILFNKDKMEWQNERQDLLNQIDFLTVKLNELKNINEKIENEKNDFRNNSKRYISQIIEEKMNQLDSN